MTLSQFDTLIEDEEKAKVVLQSVVIATREEPGLKIFLHQTPFFYVEAYFDLTKREVIRFKAFEETELLQPYLNSIDISNLLF